MTAKTEAKTAILACGAFKRELQHIYGDREIVFLPPLLHLYQDKLQAYLACRLQALEKKYEQIVVIYGHCLPDMDQFLSGFKVRRIRGEHCLEICGGERFWDSIRECPGTYFLIPSWCESFRKGMVIGLGLDKNPNMKEILFRNYKRIVYFDTQVYGNLDACARSIADYIGLPLDIERVGISSVQQRLTEVLREG